MSCSISDGVRRENIEKKQNAAYTLLDKCDVIVFMYRNDTVKME